MQLHQHEPELTTLQVNVLVVTFESESAARAYAEDMNLRWPVVTDSSRELYTAYGMELGRWWDIYGPRSWWAYAKLFAKGRRMKEAKGDFDQLGGDVLVDPGGIVRMHHVGSGPADRPTVSSILDIVRRSEEQR